MDVKKDVKKKKNGCKKGCKRESWLSHKQYLGGKMPCKIQEFF
jgi:hypothetical protein